MVLHKAYAKFRGSFARAAHGSVHQALSDLVTPAAEHINASFPNPFNVH